MKNFVFLILLFVFSVALGENPDEDFICFNTSNGKLFHNTVEAIARDQLGYIWVGTNFGLNRLDGYNTVNYINNSEDSTSISGNFIYSLFVDSDNELWIGTIGSGLNKYDRKTNSFKRIKQSGKNDEGITISAITEDKAGNIWIGTVGEGVSKYNKKTGLFKLFDISEADPYKRINSNVTKMLCDQEGYIWVGLNQGEVFRINTETEEIKYMSLFREQENFSDIGSIKGIAQQKNGTFLFVTWTGNLYKLNPKYDSQIKLLKDPSFFNNNFLSDIVIDENGNIWISTWQDGLYKIDINTDEKTHFKKNKFYPNSLGSNAVNLMFIDKYNYLWIGTIDNGLYMLSLKEKMFESIKIQDPNSPVPVEINAYSLIKDNKENLWIGTRGQGLWQYNLRTGNTENYTVKNNPELGSNSILTLEMSRDGNIWIGTDGGFISRFNPETKKFTKLINKNDDWSHAIFAIAQNDDYLWGGSWGGGIKKVDKKTLTYTSINFDDKDQFRNSVFDLEICDSILWVADIGIGLIKFNINDNSKKIYSYSESFPDFPKERILDIYIENTDSLLISTDGSGIYLFIPSKEKISKIVSLDLLSNNIIQGVLSDDNRNIWVASISGITFIERKTGNVQNFYRHNGLKNNQFNKGALLWDKDSRLIYAGGVDGVNYANTDNLIIDTLVKRTITTGLYIGSTSISKPNNKNISESIDIAKEIHLKRKDKIITIYFSSMDFNPSSLNKYYFKLSGFDKEWREADYSNNFVQYTNLFPGEYTFSVKSCNRDGLISEKSTDIKIHMHPAIWQTWIFKISMLLLVAALIFIYIRERYKNLLKAKLLLEHKVHERTSEIEKQKEHIEKQKQDLELANETKNKFFSIISHDLRNPVTSIDQLIKVILMQYDNVSDDKIKLYLNSLHKSTSNTLELLNNLLIWAQTQTNRINIKKKPIPVDDLLINIESVCDELAHNKNIILLLPFNTKLKVNADKNTIQTVLRNLVTNAIKFTNPEGSVNVKVESKGNEVIFKITDTGIGMKESEVDNLFKIENISSKTGTSGESGTGLGLVICNEFLKLNGSKLNVESQLGKGSTFWFTLEKYR